MTDRELLEQAAKVAGIEGYKFMIGAYAKSDAVGLHIRNYGTSNQRVWNPLTDDGDALRLATRLAMTVRQEPSAALAGWEAGCFGAPTTDRRGPWFWKEWLSDQQDPYAATRRAIVRAAAEIGKEMK